jgi:predicted RNase H-like nuclease
VDTFVGFDSAWTGNPKSPGAITAVSVRGGNIVCWYPPQSVSFDKALAFVRDVRSRDGTTLIALDQPTVVANATGMRPVEKAAASLVSWLGGGVQPSNTGRVGMFCAASPIWRFLSDLGALEDPEAARAASDGLFLIEVFPALALASLRSDFFGRLAAPHYNPARRKTFNLADWTRVAEATAAEADVLGCRELAVWCRGVGALHHPAKADQDKLDAALCALIACWWRCRPREASLLLGDLTSGYMVTPASPAVRARLGSAARKVGVAVDGSAA